VDDLSAALAESHPDDEARRDAALVSMASMVGAIMLARAVEDPVLSDRILLTVRRRTTQPLRTRAI
jgi:TetR/AcrR family transcriptional repressor of nem operon